MKYQREDLCGTTTKIGKKNIYVLGERKKAFNKE